MANTANFPLTVSPDPPEVDVAAELAAGRWDVERWARVFLGIQGHGGQIRMWTAILARSPGGIRPAYLTICISAGNRAGKTLGLAVVILHHAFYKIGYPPPDATNETSILAWLKAPYDWFHFGIQQETAELVFGEITRIVTGIHEAQSGRGCPLIDLFGPDIIDLKRKDRGVYPWVVLHPAFGGAQIHFRTTAEQALGSLGKDMHGISFDECAFEPKLEFVVDEVLHFRRLGTGGPLILISTATEGLTAFSDLWALGDPSAPDRSPSKMSLRMSTRENLGFGLDQEIFDRLIEGVPEYLIPQNIDGYFIESRSAFFGAQAVDAMFDPDLPEHDIVQPRHRYAHGIDPALTFDQSWSIVLDRTNRQIATGVSAQRRSGRQTTLSVSALASEQHRAYSAEAAVCSTVLDATGFGGAAFRDMLQHLRPFRALEMGGTRGKKLKMLLDLKDHIEKGRLRLPRSGLWLVLRRQLLGYRLEDRKLETDAVIALALAVSDIRRQPADPSETATFDYFGTGIQRVPSEHPFGDRRKVTVLARGKELL